MAIQRLGHYSIRTADLASSLSFYTEVLGFRQGYRPDFPFGGAWLYLAHSDADYGVVHLIEADPNSAGLSHYLGQREGEQTMGSAAVDHIAFLAADVDGVRERLNSRGIDFRERVVPNLGLIQIFITDPSGLTLELNFETSDAVGGSDKAGA
ncbi:VOC family protein [Sphingobium subterraneum]|uniref:Catechol 2,3-dioxygenase-like lactoylglutathione lyase family enzyme n=1 Tax=Sphingobium subterraneum TaxID=627688 RepID=A0A841IWP7_9SPHN|nr:catechol 2,3-dioxygenase-like lactoylglutathione lyase family enzyme [Sphingobium subterraneum]